MTRTAAERLAGHAAATRFDDLPADVAHEALRCLVNFVGCAIGGVDHDAVQAASRALQPFAGAANATLIAQSQRADAMTAAFVNGTSASAHSFDDTHAEAIVHAGAPVCAAALALAEANGRGGRDLLLAIALGAEAACRASMAVSVAPAVGNIAWYQTGIAGGIGAAIAAGRLLDLPTERLAHAIGIAVATASGSRVMQGSMAMLMLAGHAAQCGIRAALLAREGMQAPVASLDGDYGFTRVFAKVPNDAALVADLGSRHELLRNTYKAYPCGVVLHPVVDAALELRGTGIAVDAIESVEVRVHPVAIALTDRRHPAARTAAQVSLHHWTAVALATGRAGLAEGRMEVVNDPVIASLRDRVQPVADEQLARDAAQVRVRLASGERHESSLHAGCRPLDDAALERKLRAQAEPTMDAARIDDLVSALWAVREAQDLEPFSQWL